MFKETEEQETTQPSSYLVSQIYTEPSSVIKVTCIQFKLLLEKLIIFLIIDKRNLTQSPRPSS